MWFKVITYLFIICSIGHFLSRDSRTTVEHPSNQLSILSADNLTILSCLAISHNTGDDGKEKKLIICRQQCYCLPPSYDSPVWTVSGVRITIPAVNVFIRSSVRHDTGLIWCCHSVATGESIELYCGISYKEKYKFMEYLLLPFGGQYILSHSSVNNPHLMDCLNIFLNVFPHRR